jgi:hypothetical protein
MNEAQKNRKAIYQMMKIEASDPEIVAFYVKVLEEWGDIDTEIIDLQ